MKGLGGLSTFLLGASQKAESLGFNFQLSVTIRHKILIFKGHLAILIIHILSRGRGYKYLIRAQLSE